MLYPTATESRMIFDLDGIWDFKVINEAELAQDCCSEPITDPMTIAVPSSYNDLFPDKSIREHIGWVIYEREFVVQPQLLSQRIVLRFGSVSHRARVYLNGDFVGEHIGGFTPFELEAGKNLHPGKNRLSVAVSNVIDKSTLPVGLYEEHQMPGLGLCKSDHPNFDFFNYSGIHRPVRLCTTPLHYIRDITICPKLKGNDSAEVAYKVDCEGENDVAVRVLDEKDAEVASGTGMNGTVVIRNARLWQPMHAYLYRLEVRLLKDGKTVDVYEEPFGVREVRVENGKFLINGRPFYFKGFGKHEDFDVIGKGLCEPLNVKDLNLFKWIGANSFRTSHYPYSEEMMRLADREGIVVIDETTAVGLNMNFGTLMMGGTPTHHTWEELNTAENHRKVLTELIERDKNHPCVVMWSISNESATEEDGAREYFKPLVELAKRLDCQKRPVTMVLHLRSLPNTCKLADMCDVLALNRYYGWYSQSGDLDQAKAALKEELEDWQKLFPEKPIMFTEYGADTIAGMHDVIPTMFSEEYQAEMLRAYGEVADTFKNFVGEQVWNFADFATSQSLLRVGGNKKGVFTRDRRPKLAAHYLRQRWSGIPDFGYKA